jgi:hypothetical protein
VCKRATNGKYIDTISLLHYAGGAWRSFYRHIQDFPGLTDLKLHDNGSEILMPFSLAGHRRFLSRNQNASTSVITMEMALTSPRLPDSTKGRCDSGREMLTLQGHAQACSLCHCVTAGLCHSRPYRPPPSPGLGHSSQAMEYSRGMDECPILIVSSSDRSLP